jgi:hypothetical protein
LGTTSWGWYGRPATPPLYIAGDGCGRLGQGPPPNYVRRITALMRQRGAPALPLYLKTGYCEVGPHGGPLYGRHPAVENLYVIGGFNGYGSMVGPALAERLAELVGGRGSGDVFRLERYLDSKPFNPCEVAERHDWGARFAPQCLKSRYSISGVSKESEKMVLISFHVPRSYVEVIDELVRLGLYPSRSEAIRAALRELLSKYKLDGV